MRLNTIDPTKRLTTIALCALLATLLAAFGCDKSKSTGGQDSGPGPDAATQNDGATGTDGTPGQDGAGQPDGGEQPDGGGQPDGAIIGDGGTGDLVISFGTILFYLNCMPSIPPDPFVLMFELNYDNTQGSSMVTVNIVSVVAYFNTVANPELHAFVNPTTSGPVAAGATVTINHTKTSSTFVNMSNPCQTMCNTSAYLEVTVDVGGQQSVLTSPTQVIQCVQ